MITALYNVKNDVESQCDVIRALNKLNAAGLIVFYYGLVVQKFDQRVLDLCDELNFPLFLLYRKDRLRCSAELKNARTEAGMITRKFLD